ncbi:hypothetical protein K439DRAFT_1621166 [Ramaria rubella]|nr:hypothetical protein K439DRAFT_1621166 [Ramaria rubella]
MSPLPPKASSQVLDFNSKDPQSLLEYFDNELLAITAQLDETEKVKNAAKYILREDAHYWTSLPEYNQITPNYTQFKQEVFQGYPRVSLEDCWTMKDLEDLIGWQWS